MEIKLKNGEFTGVATSLGGELISFKGKRGFEHIWQGREGAWTGRNPHLFPIVGRLKDNKILAGDLLCEMPQHGIVRRREFKVMDKGEDFVEFGIYSDKETKASYPFDFLFRVRHTLLEDGFSTDFFVENTGKDVGDGAPMPFCIGAHTGFNCPMEEGEEFSDYVLSFEKEEDIYTIPLSENAFLMPDSRKLPFKGKEWALNYSDFDREDTLIFEGLKSNTVSLISKKTNRGIKCEFTGWPMLAFWSAPLAHAPFICIEPWQGCVACEGEGEQFSDKRHCVMLEPGKIWSRGYKVSYLSGV